MSQPLTFDDLIRFHRDVFLPDIERILDQKLALHISMFRDEMNKHFDSVRHRLDRMSAEPTFRVPTR